MGCRCGIARPISGIQHINPRVYRRGHRAELRRTHRFEANGALQGERHRTPTTHRRLWQNQGETPGLPSKVNRSDVGEA
jgi:hypothetical protein